MKKFQIEIEEILQRVEEIESESLEEALDIAEDRYSEQEIVLDYEDFKGHEIREYRNQVRVEDLVRDAIFNINYGQAILLEGDKNLALIKQIGKDFEAYIIVTNLQTHKKYGTYFEWDSGSRFNSISEASKEYEKRANVNKYSNDFDFSKLGKTTLKNNNIATFNGVGEIFDFLIDDEMDKEKIIDMITDETKEEIILSYFDSARKEKDEYFYSDSMFCAEEEIKNKLIKIDEILQESKLENVNPYEVIELLEQKENDAIDPNLKKKILREIYISIPNYNSGIENFIQSMQEKLEENQEEEENEL